MDDEKLQLVTLVSRDGDEFIIERKAAMASGTIKNMLSSPGSYLIRNAPREVVVTLQKRGRI